MTIVKAVTVTPAPNSLRPAVTTVDVASAFKWFAPAVHYGLAVALVLGAVAHDYFGLPAWAPLVLVGLAVVAVIVGTFIWGEHEKVSLQSTALFLKSQVPSLMADVEALKNSPSLGADETNQFNQILGKWSNIERLFGQAVAAQPAAPVAATGVPAPAPVVASPAMVPPPG